jgi:hypothetical protein
VDLVEARGALYSHRPQRHMAFLYVSSLRSEKSSGRLIYLRAGWEEVASFRSYDDRLKAFRRHVNVGFSKKIAMKYHDGQIRDVHLLLQRLLANPGDFIKELNW